jgi:hypothetical protein
MIFLRLKTIRPKYWLIFWIVVTTLLLILIGIVILNPIWKTYGIHVPGEPSTKVDFTYPVDSIFYIRNAENGYRWSAKAPTSIWFHPVISWLIEIMPRAIPANWRYYLISLVSAPLALYCVYRYAQNVLEVHINPVFIPLTIFISGGLNMATGNAESLSLLFNTLIVLSVLEHFPISISLLIGMIAILIKPNALYMLAPLAVYGIYDLIGKEYKNALRSLVIILGILITWSGWILYVDYMSGQTGAYWQAREVATVPLYAGFLTLIYRTVETFALGNLGEILKHTTAFLVLLTDLWLVLLVPFRNEKHRLANISGLIMLLLISLATSNPNKIFIYAMTLPFHLLIGWVVLQSGFQSLRKQSSLSKRHSFLVTIAFSMYALVSIGMVIFFVVGTPLGWYI